jgi:glycosyltransferase 2 family protein
MRQTILLLAKAAVTGALLYFAVGRANFGVLGERLSGLEPAWVAAALAVVMVQTFLLALRWRQIAVRFDVPLTVRRSFEFTAISIFFSQVTPSTIGADAVRIWLAGRRGASWSAATHSVLMDRFVGVLALALIVVACLPWSLVLVQNPVGRTALLAIGFGSIAAALGFIMLGYATGSWSRHWWPLRHLMEIAVKLRLLLLSNSASSQVMVLSLLSQVLTAAITWCDAHAVGASFSFFDSLLLMPPVLLISTVPISIAGWGVRETALVLAFAYAGLSQNDALVVSILFGATMFAFGIIGGIIWLASGVKLRLPAASEESHGDRVL